MKHLNFYDIVLDFILMDSFEDLENPPISIQNVVNNRWLHVSFKETVGDVQRAGGCEIWPTWLSCQKFELCSVSYCLDWPSLSSANSRGPLEATE